MPTLLIYAKGVYRLVFVFFFVVFSVSFINKFAHADTKEEVSTHEEITAQEVLDGTDKSSGALFKPYDDSWIDVYKALPLDELTQKADEGDAKAQCVLGMLYSGDEDRLPQDFNKARHYFELSAEQGNAEAQFKLGKAFDHAIGVEENYQKALHYYELSAKQDNTRAINNLGIMYDEGKGVNVDYQKALFYYFKAVELGALKVYTNIAVCYYHGNGVIKSYEKCLEYLQLAATVNEPVALYNLAVMYKNGYGVNKNLSKATEYYNKAKKYGL